MPPSVFSPTKNHIFLFKKHIIKKLPVVSSMNTIEKLSSPFSCTHPSWAFDFQLYFISPNDDVPLASPDPGTVRLYPHASCYSESSGSCLVVADSSGVIYILHDSLKAATTLGQANSFVLNKSLTYAKK
jgi:hypothetical protein